jgi:hypothetical protein
MQRHGVGVAQDDDHRPRARPSDSKGIGLQVIGPHVQRASTRDWVPIFMTQVHVHVGGALKPAGGSFFYLPSLYVRIGLILLACSHDKPTAYHKIKNSFVNKLIVTVHLSTKMHIITALVTSGTSRAVWEVHATGTHRRKYIAKHVSTAVICRAMQCRLAVVGVLMNIDSTRQQHPPPCAVGSIDAPHQ